MPVPSPARPTAAAIRRRSQSTSSAVVISPRLVAITSARSANRSARPRTSLTRAPCLAAAANSCSTARSSKVLLLGGQALGARQAVTEAPLGRLAPLDQAADGALPALPEQLVELLGAEPELCGARADLLAPGVGLDPVLLAIAGRERRASPPRPSSPGRSRPPAPRGASLLVALRSARSPDASRPRALRRPCAPLPTEGRGARSPARAGVPGRESRRSSPRDTAARRAAP